MRVFDVIEAEAPFDAQLVVVGRAVAPLHRGDIVVADLVSDLAADAAIRANAVHLRVRRPFVAALIKAFVMLIRSIPGRARHTVEKQ